MNTEDKDNKVEDEVELPESERPEGEAADAEEDAALEKEEEAPEEEKELTVEELLEQSRLEKEDLYQKVLRAAADFENFRKRSLREKDELRKFAVAGLIEEILPALDNLELGLSAADSHPEAKAVSDGFRMVAQQLTSILQDNGLKCVDPVGDDFDPNYHESVSVQPSEEVEENKVIQVSRKGYTLNGRVLRAANVIVSSGPAKEEEGDG